MWLEESAHSRVNTIYMTLFLMGGALGTTIGILLWQWGSWPLVCLQMLCFAIGIILLLFQEKSNLKKEASPLAKQSPLVYKHLACPKCINHPKRPVM